MKDIPVIALTAKWHTWPQRFEWARENGFALEYTANPDQPELIQKHLTQFLVEGIPVRYHAFFQGYELGHPDETVRSDAVAAHKGLLDAMTGRGEQVVTLHIGLNSQEEVLAEPAVENLGIIVDYARARDITVCLENLRRGPTSDPETLMRWAEESGAMVTLDIGHALGSSRVLGGEITGLEFFDIVAPRLREAHVYEKETDRHYPPADLTVIGPVLERLLDAGCPWWTIELDDFSEVLSTRNLLNEFIHNRNGNTNL